MVQRNGTVQRDHGIAHVLRGRVPALQHLAQYAAAFAIIAAEIIDLCAVPDGRLCTALITAPEIADRPYAQPAQMRRIRLAQQRHGARPEQHALPHDPPIGCRIAAKIAQVERALQGQTAARGNSGVHLRHGRSASPTGGTATVSIRVSTSLISL